jgi:hypothetical protein
VLEDGGRDVASADVRVFIRVSGESAKDRRIGLALRGYLWRDAGPQRWLSRVRVILVDRGLISVVADLRRNRRGRRIALRLCRVIGASDVTDVTGGTSSLIPRTWCRGLCGSS